MARSSAGILESLNKSEMLRALVRHKLMGLCIIVVGMALTAGYTYSLPVLYRSTSSVLIENYSRLSYGGADEPGLSYIQDITKAQRVLAQSRPVLRRTFDLVGEPLEGGPDGAIPLNFETRVDGQLLYLHVADLSPERAQKLANAWSEAFIKEMKERSKEPRTQMASSLEEWRQDWLKRLQTLHKFQAENNFLDAKEFGTSPVWKRFEDLSAKLTEKNIDLGRLEAEQQMLAKGATAALDTPRAKEDLMIQSAIKQREICQSHLHEIREKFKADSPEVKAAEQRLSAAQGDLQQAGEALAKQVQVQYAQVKTERDGLQKLCDEAEKKVEELKAKGIEFTKLSHDSEMAQHLYEAWKAKSAELKNNVEMSSNAKAWDAAEASLLPYKPNWRQNLIFGFLLASLAALAFAYVLEKLDDTVRSGRDLERRLDVAPLGVIPIFERTLADADGYLLAQRQANSSVVDAIRNIHIGLEVTHGAHRTGQPLIITVTSAMPSEGKSFLASNLAILFASLGRKVLVVDADLRKGSLSKAFKCRSKIGLREAIASGKWSPSYTINGVTPGYALLPVAEHSYTNPESLSPEGFEQILGMMKTQYDVLLFDTPPVLAVPDACVIGHLCDVTIVVARSRHARMAQVERAAASLYAANVKQLSFVVNGVDSADAASDSYGYGYDYNYGYGYGYGYGQKRRSADAQGAKPASREGEPENE
ncbi:MAG TPA: P-loop NTPase [Planctomycetota bacterium]|jgi:capsular exopolysaccharide synthesis family protein